MAINRTIISAQASSSRAENKQLYIQEVPVAPPESYLIGLNQTATQEPTRLGEFVYVRFNRTNVVMYVVVSIEGALTWKEVRSGVVFIDSDTGLPWDPNAGFYNINKR